MFICNHCPYVQAVEDRLAALHREYDGHGVRLVGICSNDPTDYPDDAPAKLLARWRRSGSAFRTASTPRRTWRGRSARCARRSSSSTDPTGGWRTTGASTTAGAIPHEVTRRELADAIDALLAGRAPAREQVPSMGCSIKWRRAS